MCQASGPFMESLLTSSDIQNTVFGVGSDLGKFTLTPNDKQNTVFGVGSGSGKFTLCKRSVVCNTKVTG